MAGYRSGGGEVGRGIYRMDARAMTEEDHEVWAPRFTCGTDWWAVELNEWLHRHAWEGWRRGHSKTTLFSYRGSPEIVGFITVTAVMLVTQDLRGVLGFTDPMEPTRQKVPAVHLLYFGVAENEQHQGNGVEIYAQFLESLESSVLCPRFVHLEVWEDNTRAVEFYKRNSWRELGTRRETIPYTDVEEEGTLIRMVLDRHHRV